MQTEDQMRAEYIRVMGGNLGQWYYELEQDLDWLHRKWSIFQGLFDKGLDRREMLYSVAPNFFHPLHSFLFEDAMLHLCRLTDPPRTGRYENRTMMSLSEQTSDVTLKASLNTAADQVQKDCEFARSWRDKRLAHTDLQVSRSGNAGLPVSESRNIEKAICAMRGLLKLVREHYGIALGYSLSSDPFGAEALVRCLEDGIRVAEKEDELAS